MKTIVITGVSSGLGKAMALEAMKRGHTVIGTVRQKKNLTEFEATFPGRAIGRLLDVTSQNDVSELIHWVETEVGPIDVLVNNAGYGLKGVIEELEIDDLRHQFEVNLIAPISLIQAVLPSMRSRRAGHIINIASMGGMIAFPNLGAYHGTKFALIGMTDSLAHEVSPLGIAVTAILPGVYGTDWGGRSQRRARHKIADYDQFSESKSDFNWGDPAAFARVVGDCIEMSEPPLHLLVGPTAVKLVRQRLAELSGEIDRLESMSQAEGEG